MFTEALQFSLTTHKATVAEGNLVTDENRGRVFKKEVIYSGRFQKGEQDFEIDSGLINHWVKSVDLQLANGVRIDLTSGHPTEDDPTASRGKVIGAEAGKNEEDLDALYLFVEFANDDYVGLADTAEASIFSPPSYTDGKGNDYFRPLRGLALTQDPVIPKLAGFDLVLSFKEPKMDLKTVATDLGIEVGEEATDEEIAQLIKSHDDEIKASLAEAKKPVKEKPKEIVASQDTELNRNLLKRARAADIASLKGKVTPAVSKKLEEQYCSDEALSLALSNPGINGVVDNVFDTLKTLPDISQNPGTGTGPQVLELSGPDLLTAKNPLIADAEAKAKQARQLESVN